ncbi:MAG: hypothetical protein LAT77_06225 [Aliidiomarina sp.]|uniref:hypothetical protein n=1 Tax=Aliidiomarina sp. TaxID=1872439 RepID=UPI0025C13690|nr:hypothetical protein [Aliidiomarina sp.]MCH8501491.1 hypothetical protein [Aliidiomarina sp.]
MKSLLLIIAVLASFNTFASTQSAEEYIEEVNKAFGRFFEATNGKSFSQQVIAIEALYLEFEDNEAVQDVLLQSLGDVYSFLGLHQRALMTVDSRVIESGTFYDEIKRFEVHDAIAAILERSSVHQFVMINEAHHVPKHRVLTYQLLAGLWEQGYRYLALEALAENAEQNITIEHIPLNAGHYTKEPIFANLLLYAQELGFQLVSYDYGFEIQGTIAEREKSGASNLREKIFTQNPDAKVIIHVGYNHINEESRLAHYLKESLGLDPLTINQTDIGEKSEQQYESESYAWMIANHAFDLPIVLLNEAGELWSASSNKYDVNVIWPRTVYIQNRPDWAYLGRVLKLTDLAWCQEIFPCTVEVYNSKSEGAVPTDRILILSENDTTGVFISPSSRKIKVTNAAGDRLHTEIID